MKLNRVFGTGCGLGGAQERPLLNNLMYIQALAVVTLTHNHRKNIIRAADFDRCAKNVTILSGMARLLVQNSTFFS